MFNLSSLVQKAQSFIDPTQALNISPSDRNPAKSTLFRNQFRLPDTQTPLQEITAELTISPPVAFDPNATQGEKDKDRERGYHYAGKLHLSEEYLCFSTQPTSFLQTASTSTSSGFTGQTHGAGPGGNGFTLPLCAIRRVERLQSQIYQVREPGLALTAALIFTPVCVGHNDMERDQQYVYKRCLEDICSSTEDHGTTRGKSTGLRKVL